MKIYCCLISLFFHFTTNLSFASGLEKNNVNQLNNDTTFIYLKDFDFKTPEKKDALKKLHQQLKTMDANKPKVLIFEKDVYHFSLNDCSKRNYFESNTSDINPRFCVFVFEGINNLQIRGNGSTILLEKQMQPFTFDNCKNLTLSDVNIDWTKPLIAQGEVLTVSEKFIDIKINEDESPFLIEDDKLLFKLGENKTNKWKATMEFDREGRFITPKTGDWGCLGRGWQNYKAERKPSGIVRLNYTFLRKPAVGNYLVLRHAERIHAGIFIQESKDISIKNVNLYHATGLGILAQFSENLTFNGYRAIPNPHKNRYFGGGDDGLQVSNCKGLVSVKNCEFAGLMDDPINVHGTSVQIQKILSKNKLECKFMHHQSIGMNWGHKGDKINFIENERMNSIGVGEIADFERIDAEIFTVTFKTPVPEFLQEKDALENLTWSPDVHVNNCHFKSCRARGLLISTPGKVVIENNIFESSGSAILIAGDANGWFESGAVNHVLIQNNVFTDLCNTSSYQFCEGIISIYPIIPELDEKTPAFHQNISIINNKFHPFDFPVLYAKSVNGIQFEKNSIERSYRFEPYHERKFTFSFESCTNINLSNNHFSEDLLGKNILLEKTALTELNCQNKKLTIELK